MRTVIKFSQVPMHAIFTPARGSVGANSPYLKKSGNGICPLINGKSRDDVGIFYPDDAVLILREPRPNK